MDYFGEIDFSSAIISHLPVPTVATLCFDNKDELNENLKKYLNAAIWSLKGFKISPNSINKLTDEGKKLLLKALKTQPELVKIEIDRITQTDAQKITQNNQRKIEYKKLNSDFKRQNFYNSDQRIVPILFQFALSVFF